MDTRSTPWPAAMIAARIIVLIGAITITAMVQYTAEEAMKFWTTLSGVLGAVTGAIVTYFFNHEQVLKAENKTADANEKAHEAEIKADETKSESKELAKLSMSALLKLSGEMSPDIWKKFETDPCKEEVSIIF